MSFRGRNGGVPLQQIMDRIQEWDLKEGKRESTKEHKNLWKR